MTDRKKHATVHDIAKHLNISASTVSRALNDHPKISTETKNKVKAAALKLDYGQNASTDIRKELIGKTVAIIVPDLELAKHQHLAEAARLMFEEKRYKTMICASSDSVDKENENLKLIQNLGLDGILISLSSESKQAKHIKPILKKTPIIQFDKVNFDLACSRITVDYFQAGYKATQLLLNTGCKKIAHIGGKFNCPSAKQISIGYKTAARNSSARFGDKLELFSDNMLYDIPKAVELLFSQKIKPDGIIIDDILAGNKLFSTLKTMKFDIPNNIAIVAIGDDKDYSFGNASLTSIVLPYQKLGSTAAQKLIQAIEMNNKADAETVILPFSTKISNSTLINTKRTTL